MLKSAFRDGPKGLWLLRTREETRKSKMHLMVLNFVFDFPSRNEMLARFPYLPKADYTFHRRVLGMKFFEVLIFVIDMM